jgi:hypothetical protein
VSIITTKIKLKPIALSGDTTGATIINQFANIKFTLGNDDGFLGFQQEIDRLTSFTSIDLINPAIDEERWKYKTVSSPSLPTIGFYFGSSPTNSYTNNGFTTAESTQNSDNFLNSFFILDFYDTYDINKQTKLFTTYLTKKGITGVSQFTIDSTNQLYYWYLPVSYIELQTGTTSYAYVKFMFYNAKTGKVVPFYNKDNEALSSSERIHFKVELNHISRTWKFISPNYPTIKAYEITNAAFTTKVNNTVEDRLNTIQQSPPSGTTFTAVGGSVDYLTT